MSFYELESDGAEDGFDGLCDGIFYIVIRLQSGRWGNSSLGKEFRDTSNNPFVVAMMDDGCRGKGLLVELLLVVPDVMINEAEAGQGSVAFRSSGVAEFICLRNYPFAFPYGGVRVDHPGIRASLG